MPTEFTNKFKYAVDGSGLPFNVDLSGQAPIDLGQAPYFDSLAGVTFRFPQGVTGPDGTTAPRSDSVSYHILRNISSPQFDPAYIDQNFDLEETESDTIVGVRGLNAYLRWAIDLASSDNTTVESSDQYNWGGAQPKIQPVFPNPEPNSGITEEFEPEEAGDYISEYYQQIYQFDAACIPELNKGFRKLGLGYNPNAEWVLGVTQAGTVGATTGFTLGARCGQTQWWFGNDDGNTGNTAGVTGEICQILDLTDVSGSTYVQGVGTISGGVYALFIKSVGPTGGTYGRGLTMFRPGTTGPEYLYDLGSAVTGSIQYAQSLFPAQRCKNILNDLKLTASMRMLENPVEITGGTGGTEDPEQHAFKARIKPRRVNVILEGLLARKQTLIDQKDVFAGPTGSIPIVEEGKLGDPGGGSTLPNAKVSIIPGTSTNSGANKANISAFDELVHGLYTIQNKIRTKFDRMFLGATGASLDTIYKIKHFLPKIEHRIQRVGPWHDGATAEGGLPRTIWD